MRIAVENILLINFLMDFFILICAIRPVRRISLPRTIIAAITGAAFSAAILVQDTSALVRAIFSLAMIPVMLRISCGGASAKAITYSGAAFLAAGSVTAALIPMLGKYVPFWLAAILAVGAAGAVLTGRKKWLSQWDVQVEIIHSGKTIRFCALLDTGNRLTEPISGLPVMIVSQPLLEDILQEDFDPFHPWRTLPEGFRLVSYGGVGGTGELGCFMPENMYLTADNRRIGLKDAVWVAVYPGKLPGKTAALAPVSSIQ